VFVFNLTFLLVDTSRTGGSFITAGRQLFILYIIRNLSTDIFANLGCGRLQVDFRFSLNVT